MQFTKQQGIIAIRVDKESYRPNEILRGTIYIKVNKPDIPFGNLYVQMIGIEKANQLDQFEQFYSLSNVFYKKQRKVSHFGKTLPVMEIKKCFELTIPQKYSSFQINYYKTVQCRILYALSVYFENEDGSKKLKAPKTSRIQIIILPPMESFIRSPLKNFISTGSIKACCFMLGDISMSVHIPQNQYNLGDEIPIKISINNQQSKLKVQYFEISIQSQLSISYSSKRILRSHFGLCSHKINESVPPKTQKSLQIKIYALKDNDEFIYPQSSIQTTKLVYQYNLAVTAVLEKPFLYRNAPTCRAILPIELLQRSNKELNEDQFISPLNSLQSANIGNIATLQSLKGRSKQHCFGDHETEGYGQQYGSPYRLNNFNISLDDSEMKDHKEIQKQLYLQIRNKSEDNVEEELINKIESQQEQNQHS